jgi:hypothetical protein
MYVRQRACAAAPTSALLGHVQHQHSMRLCSLSWAVCSGAEVGAMICGAEVGAVNRSADL